MRAYLLPLVLAGSLAACEPSATLPGGDAGSAGCRSADCDDGLFCNGVELCAPAGGGCLPPSGSPCESGQTCDEEAHRCVTECAVALDADGDGARARECGGTDCDDADPLAHPGATEICDDADRDEDCDSATLGERDGDGDGAIDAACCNGARCGTDCDDAASDVRPGQSETCDGRDDDCDGAADEGVERLFFPDLDGDGYGDRAGTPMRRCAPDTGLAENALDCDDRLAEAAPGRSERCALAPDGAAVDEDCDGAVDEALAVALECASRFGSPPHTSYACSGGACVVAPCPMGWGDCDAEPSNGCETDLTAAVDHCGTCGRACGAGGECLAGTCDRVVDVAAGDRFTCARRARIDGTPTSVVCWGANEVGQLGDGTTTARTSPVVTRGVSGAIDLAVSGSPTVPFGPDARSQPFGCVRTASGFVLCWGSNESGQLGRGTTGAIGLSAEPAAGVPDFYLVTTGTIRYVGGELRALELGAAHAATLERTMTMDPSWVAQAWGGATSGIGATSTATATGISIDRYSYGVDVAAGGSHTCVAEVESCPAPFCTTSVVTCLGSRNDFYQLGSTDLGVRSNRIVLSADELDAGLAFTCARNAAGGIRCWGSNTDGELGDRRVGVHSATPVAVLDAGAAPVALTGALQVSAGGAHACARRADRSVVCWGRGVQGQLGDGSSSGPGAVVVSGLADVVDVSAGADHTCAVLGSGEVWCWGGNDAGQLGTGDTMASPIPARVAGLSN